MAEFTINGVALALDIDDLDEAEKARNAITDSQTKLESVQDDADYITGGRRTCVIINECFDTIFGAGTADKVFTGMKFMVHVDAFAALGEAIGQQIGKQNDHINALTAKYGPNRAARRSKK